MTADQVPTRSPASSPVASNLKATLKAEAMRLGFVLAGVAPAVTPPHLETYHRWLDADQQAGMTYLNSPRHRLGRAHPENILPGCRSLFVVALPYPNPARYTPPPVASGPRGRIAAYAWDEDYHTLIPARLQALLACLPSGCRAAIYTDSAAILERDFAQLAGLGWIGKNTCLIAPNLGSAFLLAEVLLDISLEPDPPFLDDRCGRCQRCIQACPTRCIRPDRTLDASRCLAYQTIENKGSIPPELRPLAGNWIFGCDMCQAVCPWNQHLAATRLPAFPPPEISYPDLRQELHLSPQAFQQKFERTSVLRTRRRGYLRNVAVALGNLQDTSSLPDLVWSLENEPEPLVRAHVAWALGQLQHAAARQALATALARETDPAVRLEIQAALPLT